MELQEGDKIKVFKDTDSEAYIRFIKENLHFRATLKGDYIIIGKPYATYNTTNYSKQIMEARKAKKMSRKELAELCGVREQTVIDWELWGVVPKNWKKVQKILEI